MQLYKTLTTVPRLLYHPAAGYVVLFLSLLLTGLAWHFSVEYSKSRALDRFEFQVEEIESTIRQRMDQYARILQAGTGLFAASDSVEREEWYRFVSSLKLAENYPGTQGLGVSVVIEPANLQEHIATIRGEGFPEYSVRPEGQRTLYTSIVFLEPFDWRNQRAFGFDMYSEAMRRSAMDKAIETGQPSISGKVTLVQETGQDVQAGFLMYVPIYHNDLPIDAPESVRREHLEGFVYAVLRGSDLMQNVLQHIGDDIGLQIFDGQETTDAALYRSRADIKEADASLLSSSHRIEMYGRQWVVAVDQNSDATSTGEYRQSTLVGLSGLVIDFLLFYTIHLIGRQRRLLDQRRYTEELERSNTQLQLLNSNLEKSNRDLEGFAYAASHDLKSPLRAMSSLAEFIKDDTAGILPEASAKHLELLQSRADRLAHLLDDMIEYARVGGTHLEASVVNVNQLTTELVELLDVPSRFAVAIDIDMPPVRTQVVPLRQVLMNLIGNAIKHHDLTEGRIGVHCRYSDNRIECVVSDDGPGIPAEFRALVLEMFKTLQSRDQREGSGMGLTLVRRYVESNHGDLRFLPNTESERGLSVYFSWPASLATDETPQPVKTTVSI